MYKLIARIVGLEKYYGTEVKLLNYIKEDGIDYSEVSRMCLVRTNDGKNVVVFEDEIEKIG